MLYGWMDGWFWTSDHRRAAWLAVCFVEQAPTLGSWAGFGLFWSVYQANALSSATGSVWAGHFSPLAAINT
jgi:hypothetical protein